MLPFISHTTVIAVLKIHLPAKWISEENVNDMAEIHFLPGFLFVTICIADDCFMFCCGGQFCVAVDVMRRSLGSGLSPNVRLISKATERLFICVQLSRVRSRPPYFHVNVTTSLCDSKCQ